MNFSLDFLFDCCAFPLVEIFVYAFTNSVFSFVNICSSESRYSKSANLKLHLECPLQLVSSKVRSTAFEKVPVFSPRKRAKASSPLLVFFFNSLPMDQVLYAVT